MNPTRAVACAAFCLIAIARPAMAENVTQGFVHEAYVHDCCGRGPYVAVILDRVLTNPPPCTQWNTVAATSVSAPLAKPLLAAALAAKMSGKQVMIYTKGSCDSTGAFDEWVGIRVLE